MHYLHFLTRSSYVTHNSKMTSTAITKPIADDPELSLPSSVRSSYENAIKHIAAHRYTLAVPLLLDVIEAAPNRYDTRYLLADTYVQLEQLDNALGIFNELFVEYPTRSDAAYNVAVILARMDHFELALQLLERALSIEPTHRPSLVLLGQVLKGLGNWNSAIDVYKVALGLDQRDPRLLFDLGSALVGSGNWKDGWAIMESREEALSHELFFSEQLDSPKWQGGSLENVRLLVKHEQGLGDAIMCARFSKQLSEMGAQVHWRCTKQLVDLIGTSPGMASCTAIGSTPPEHDQHIYFMSLMHALQIEPSDLDGMPYMSPIGSIPSEIAALLAQNEKPKVALAWSGSPKHTNDRRRSIKGELMADLLHIEGVQFLAMQKYPRIAQVLPHELHNRVVDASTYYDTFNDSAHLLKNVDLLVTVDTAAAHLAGAIGTPTLLLLPFTPDYRWGISGSTTPWYNSVTILRQDKPGNWESVLSTAGEYVRNLRKKY